ncbi:hypothetical protein AMTRI_Chr09g14780 [Amborella trichopoda]|nr:probable xyloglucan galactosyltransferase GT20 [Amborella trichopoda]|eukprot:XP_006828798.2 probable xyloglucan galactosyltransferase GT20 [Amborella trichopoda]
MAATLLRKRALEARRLTKETGLLELFLRKLLILPATIILLMLLCFWVSSTLLSFSFFHFCISSRKLDVYCLSAGTAPISSHHQLYQTFDKGIEASLPSHSKNYSYPILDSTKSSSNQRGETFDKDIKVSLKSLPQNYVAPVVDSAKSSSNQTDHTFKKDTRASLNSFPQDFSTPATDSAKSSQREENFDKDIKALLPHVPQNSSQPIADTTTTNKGSRRNMNIQALSAVEEQMKALRTLRNHALTRNKTCQGRGIYVYDLPSKFNKNLEDHCEGLLPWTNLCNFFSNKAMGQPIQELGPNWYNTHQYSLELIFHHRMNTHPCRVYDPSQALLFYVPFYAGLDAMRWHFRTNVSNELKDQLGLDLVRWLDTKLTWKKNQGKDHVFVLGKISWDFRRTNGGNPNWGTSFLELEALQNPTKVLIERQPWHPNDVAVPHPTYFHPRVDQDIKLWQTTAISSKRPKLIALAAGTRVGPVGGLRARLIEQCTLADHTCEFLNCSQSRTCGKPERVVSLFMGSEFCLQPPGDSPTRKSVFDALVAGCIPVIFDPFTAYYQYAWHLPEERERWSVYLDGEEVREGRVDVVGVLKGVRREERDRMRRFILEEVMPGLVYAEGEGLEWFRDAFDITLDALVERVRRDSRV